MQAGMGLCYSHATVRFSRINAQISYHRRKSCSCLPLLLHWVQCIKTVLVVNFSIFYIKFLWVGVVINDLVLDMDIVKVKVKCLFIIVSPLLKGPVIADLWDTSTCHIYFPNPILLPGTRQARNLYCILFVWFLTSQSTIFQLCWDGSSLVEPVLSKD